MTARGFTVGQVMTVLVGDVERTFCTWGELLDVLGHLRQDVPLAEEVGNAIKQCRPHVAAQQPQLAGYTRPGAGASDTEVLAWLAEIEAASAPLLDLVPIAEEAGE